MLESLKVFISYTHDSKEHKDRVLALSDHLRVEGVDCRIDQYLQSPPEGWLRWCETQVEESTFVLVVCTETYLRRFKGDEAPGMGLSGTWEGHIITREIYNSQGKNYKFIPVIFRAQDAAYVPMILQGATAYHVPDGYESLYRRLMNQSRRSKLPVDSVKSRLALEVPPSLPELEGRQKFLQPWNVPYPKNPFFTGRGQILEALRAALAMKEMVLLSGPDGVGKTQTATEYAYRHRKEYGAVIWTRAESRDTLLSDFVSISALLHLPESATRNQEVAVGAVRRWLEGNTGWLLVLDDAHDLTLASEFIPRNPQGRVLITTRPQTASAIADRVEIREMAEEEGMLFLLRRAGIIANNAPLSAAGEADAQLAKQIYRELGGLALALDQAGALTEATRSSLAGYLALYRSERSKLLADGAGLGDHPSLSVSLSLAIKKVAEASAAAADVVHLCAFLAPDAIPEEIFTGGSAGLGESFARVQIRLDFAQVHEKARQHSLIDRDPKNKTLRIHRLVQSVIRHEMGQAEERKWAEHAVRAVAQAFPRIDFSTWPRCERILPHAETCAALVEEFGFEFAELASLLDRLGLYLSQRTRYAEAEALCERAMTIREKSLGPEHPDVAESLSNLADIYRATGRCVEAELLYRRALAISEKASASGHPDVGMRLTKLAGLYFIQARYAEAERICKRALRIRGKALGPDDPDLATSLNNLAEVYRAQGKYAEAEPLYRRALGMWERVLGPEHPDVAACLDNLAVLYYVQGKYAEAQRFSRQSLQIWETLLGPDHPDMAQSLNNLAEVYRAQGLYAEAESLCQRALEARLKALGPDHPEVAERLNDLALLCRAQAKYAEAERLYQRILTIWEKLLGPDHPDVATSLNKLAELYRTGGKYVEAKELYERALGIRERAFGSDHPDVAASLNNLAAFYDDQGKYAEAEPLYQRALAIGEVALGPDHPSVAISLNNLAFLHCAQGKYVEAESLYQRALRIWQEAQGMDHLDVATVLENYADLLRTTGRDSQAAEMDARAEAILSRRANQNPSGRTLL